MTAAPINEVLATNLKHFMDLKGWTQPMLSKRSGVPQTTISLYLKPENRKPSAKGKAPSATLAHIDKLAAALDVPVWELLRAFTPKEREAYRQIEQAFRLLSGAPLGNGASPLLLAA